MSCQQAFEEAEEYVRAAGNNVLSPGQPFFVLFCTLIVKGFEGAHPLLFSVPAGCGNAEPCLPKHLLFSNSGCIRSWAYSHWRFAENRHLHCCMQEIPWPFVKGGTLIVTLKSKLRKGKISTHLTKDK